MKKLLGGILPGPSLPVPKPDKHTSVQLLEDPDMEARQMRERMGKDQYDSDEEGSGPGGARAVQCAQQ
jgi:hypothetical protein